MTEAPKPFGLEQGLSWMAIWAALDQTGKWAIVHGFDFKSGEPLAVLPFVDFTLIWNTGISYGLLGDNGDIARWGLSFFAIIAIVVFMWFLRGGQSRLTGMAYALFAGGALGNLVDRLWYGAVVDFISLHAAGYYWYVFNLADVWISFAVVLLVYDAWGGQKTAD